MEGGMGDRGCGRLYDMCTLVSRHGEVVNTGMIIHGSDNHSALLHESVDHSIREALVL